MDGGVNPVRRSIYYVKYKGKEILGVWGADGDVPSAPGTRNRIVWAVDELDAVRLVIRAIREGN